MVLRCLLLLLLTLLPLPSLSTRPRPNILRRMNPTYTPLSAPSLPLLTNLTSLSQNLDFNSPTSLLFQLLIPRAAGSKNLTKLQSLAERHFSDLGWKTERDHFSTETPIGIKSFTNLIFTHDPLATRKLVLAAHLDSKYFPTHPEDQFVGATDSAAPCAILMDLAEALTGWLDRRRERVLQEGGEEERETQGETLQIVFFDGEEAFKVWTHEDSIYGAKHLVELWSKPDVGPSPTTPLPPTPLSRISHLILLDLLGAPNPVIRSFYSSTGWLFDEFLHSEERLGEAGLLWDEVGGGEEYERAKVRLGGRERSFFVKRKGATTYGGGIEDDHLPFLEKGVPVVHLITMPFPRVWHTLADDAKALDLPTIKAWALIIRLTIAEYLGLDPDLDSSTSNKGKRKRSTDELSSTFAVNEL